ncbi:MAG TPA: SDR family oxidoreductase [Candidatus Limnocylindrales bacterium]
MILVVGATGLVGSEVCRRLAAAGMRARALVRDTADPAKVQALRELGLDIATGDVRDPASLGEACQGVSDLICTLSSMPFSYVAGENDIATTDREGVLRLVDVARRSGVDHFVYTSFSSNIDLQFPLRDAKRTVEAYLKLSGLSYTILRPSYFMEVWLSPAVGFDAANATATVYGDGTRPISWISLADVAAFAVASLNNPAARNATFELGGPAALSPNEVVATFEGLAGRPFSVQSVPAETLAAQQADSRDAMAQSFAGLMRCYARGDAIDMAATLRALPITLTTVREYAARTLGVAPTQAAGVA